MKKTFFMLGVFVALYLLYHCSTIAGPAGSKSMTYEYIFKTDTTFIAPFDLFDKNFAIHSYIEHDFGVINYNKCKYIIRQPNEIRIMAGSDISSSSIVSIKVILVRLK